jgi:hypothetical protein
MSILPTICEPSFRFSAGSGDGAADTAGAEGLNGDVARDGAGAHVGHVGGGAGEDTVRSPDNRAGVGDVGEAIGKDGVAKSVGCLDRAGIADGGVASGGKDGEETTGNRAGAGIGHGGTAE